MTLNLKPRDLTNNELAQELYRVAHANEANYGLNPTSKIVREAARRLEEFENSMTPVVPSPKAKGELRVS